MKLLLILFLITILGSSSYATGFYRGVDPLNTYRFNRVNHNLGRHAVRKKSWFEWWYYKVVLPDTGESFYFVYGVVNPWDTKGKMAGTRAYVGVGDFTQKINFEQLYAVEDFSAAYDQTLVQVGPNVATDRYIKADLLNAQGEEFSWDISIHKKWTFNPTSWATGKMLTNIEWYTAQADATCSGRFISKGRLYQFTDAPCYQDRNWGRSFPRWWTWIVANRFENATDAALAIGGGNPKVLGREIGLEGVSVGLKYQGKEYSFRPNDLDHVKIDISFGKWEVTAYDRHFKVEVSAYAPASKFMDLQFMDPVGHTFHDYETLTGDLVVKLYRRRGFLRRRWELMTTLTSHYAGIEYGSFDLQGDLKSFSTKKHLLQWQSY